ncbi:hypothetical protein [Nonomuraea sp. NPDC050540]|uniref:hypothetical protein n=1 Tax=Nonomuraea sp. NPDC050540 TaxID=3364367 RepID=UPI0037A8F845
MGIISPILRLSGKIANWWNFYSMYNLAQGYAADGMTAYVELQEAEFAAAH